VVLFFGMPSMQSGFIELIKSTFRFMQALTGSGLGV